MAIEMGPGSLVGSHPSLNDLLPQGEGDTGGEAGPPPAEGTQEQDDLRGGMRPRTTVVDIAPGGGARVCARARRLVGLCAH